MNRLGLGLVALLSLAACEHTNGKNDKKQQQPPSQVQPPQEEKADPNAVRPPVAADLAEYVKDIPGEGSLVATIDTGLGTFHCELFGDKAPMTVANFVGLATGKKPWKSPGGDVQKGKPFFDGLVFHRVIPEFMIQGGDPLGKGTGGPGYQFADEVNNGLTMQPGGLAMANSGGGRSNGSQFFINEIGPDWLNNKHTIFGQCKEVDLVKTIARAPQQPVTINKVTISKMKSW